MSRLSTSKETISSQRTTWIAFAALSLAANVPTLLNASVASPAHLAACVAAQGITLYVVLLAFLRPRITLLVYGILLLFIFPFDAISIIGTNSPLSYGMISATLKTTPPEAFAQIKVNLHFIILFIAAITAYFIVLFRYIPWRFKLSPTARFFAPIAALTCTLTITTIAAIPYANRTEQTKSRAVQTTTDKSFLLLFPIRDAKLISAYVKDEREIKEKIISRQPFPDSLFKKLPGFDSSCIGILSIGETSRACRWQLAGAERQTNPRLIQREDLFFYADAYSGSNLTEFSAPMYFSNDRPEKIRTWQSSPILNEIFNARGIFTGLVTSQGYRSQWRATSFVLLTATSSASELITSYGVEPHVPDIQLIAPVNEMLKSHSSPLFITFWGYGGHHDYTDRYPQQDEVFTPANKKNMNNELNAFDNTIVHTDRVHDSLISLLEATGKPAFLIYAADHGETLYDVDGQNHYHGTMLFSHGEAHVPCFVWLSKQYIARYPGIASALVGNLSKPVQTIAVFHTVQHLMHCVGPDFDSTLSLASRSYHANASRDGLNANCELIPAPPYDSLERKRIDSVMAEQVQRHRYLLK